MKKLLILIGAISLLGATAYAQTQRTNRTRTRSHDRTEVIKDTNDTAKRIDKASHESDMDRNNSNKKTTNPPATPTNPK